MGIYVIGVDECWVSTGVSQNSQAQVDFQFQRGIEISVFFLITSVFIMTSPMEEGAEFRSLAFYLTSASEFSSLYPRTSFPKRLCTLSGGESLHTFVRTRQI